MEEDLMINVLQDLDILLKFIDEHLDSGNYSKELNKVYSSLKYINVNLNAIDVINLIDSEYHFFEYGEVIKELLQHPSFNPKFYN